MGKATKPTFAKLKGYDQVRASQSLPCSVAILRRSPHILRASSENQSAKFFGIRFRSVFPEFELQVIANGLPDVDTELKHVANAYYREIRCGLFHDAMTRTGTVVVKGADHTLQVAEHPVTKKLRIEIDPFQLLNRIQTHFDGYVAKLRNSSDTAVRENFEREWDRRTSA